MSHDDLPLCLRNPLPIRCIYVATEPVPYGIRIAISELQSNPTDRTSTVVSICAESCVSPLNLESIPALISDGTDDTIASDLNPADVSALAALIASTIVLKNMIDLSLECFLLITLKQALITSAVSFLSSITIEFITGGTR